MNLGRQDSLNILFCAVPYNSSLQHYLSLQENLEIEPEQEQCKLELFIDYIIFMSEA